MKNVLRMICSILMGSVGILLFSSVAFADNPVVQTNYTADPAPMVYNDTVYLYTTHDEDNTVGGFFTMNDWRCYSTKDMVNWTDHGEVFSLEDISWAQTKDGARAWAAQCIERNGKFYLYVPVLGERPNNMMIGVGVSDSPTGPFEDLGEPLINLGTWDEIDPTVFVDDDGQAYLYWGNPTLKYVKLNEDMISYDKDFGVKILSMTPEQFGERLDPEPEDKRTSSYEEGPWAYKRNDLYYMVYAAGPLPEHIAYSTSKSPLGPWEYRGSIMPDGPNTAFTIHPGIVDFKDRSYLFYHNQTLPGGGGFKRSACVNEFEYEEDGTISTINATQEGVSANGSLNPYTRVEAETIAWTANRSRTGKDTAYYNSLVKTEPCIQGGMNIHNIRNDNYIKVKDVDFGIGGVSSFIANVACGEGSAGGKIQLYIDDLESDSIGELSVSDTGGWDAWEETTTSEIEAVTGIHDLYFVFTGEETNNSLFKVDYWEFTSYVSEVKLNASQIELKVGEERKLTATVVPDSIDTNLKWTSANTNVATVAPDGTVKALAQGTTTITAEAQDGSGKKGTCEVKVIPIVSPTPVTYKIIYQLNGGSNNNSNPSTYTSGKVITLKEPTRSNYTFGGWYSDSNFNTSITNIAGKDIVVYAKWTKVSVAKAKIKSLKNGKSKQAKLVINKVNGAKGYQFMYALNAKFKKGKKVVTLNNTSSNIKKLKKGKTYYFKVRAYKLDSQGKKIYGKYSSVKKIKIKK